MINAHLSLSKADSLAHSSTVRSGLMYVGDGKRPLLERTFDASVDLKNLIKIGRGHLGSRFELNFPRRKNI